MKILYRIPSKDPYGYVEIETEGRIYGNGNLNEFVEQLEELMAHQKGGTGLSEKQMDSIVETMCLGDNVEGGVDLYATMTPDQKKETQRLKRALDRISRKENVVDFEEPERDLESN